MIAPPEFKAELVTLNKNGGVERLQQVLKLLEKEIKSRGGIFKILSQQTPIWTNKNDIDKEKIIADACRNEDDERILDENNSEDIDIDLDGDEMQTEEDESITVTTLETNYWFLFKEN